MSADAFYVFIGIAFEVTSDQELEAIENNTDLRVVAARKSHLHTCFDRLTDGQPHFLLIGTRLGTFGAEDLARHQLSETQLHGIFAATRAKLAEAGFQTHPSLHLRLAARY